MKLTDIKNIYIQEAPIAGLNDMPIDDELGQEYHKIQDFTQTHTKLLSFNIPQQDISAYTSDDGDIYITVTIGDQIRIIGKQDLTPIGTLMGYNNVYSITTIEILPKFRSLGISTILYHFLVHNLKYVLVSGNKQYYGARRLWSKLSNMSDLSVDVINIRNQQVIAQGIKLGIGHQEDEFDEKYWGRNTSVDREDYKNIRFVLHSK